MPTVDCTGLDRSFSRCTGLCIVLTAAPKTIAKLAITNVECLQHATVTFASILHSKKFFYVALHR